MVGKIRQRLKRVPGLARGYNAVLWQMRKLADWKATRLPGAARQVRTPYGFTLTAGSYRANLEMQEGRFEPDEVKLMQRLLRDVDVLVDVGANIGLYTCLARSAGRRAIAIEPQERNLALLRATLRVNGWEDTEVHPVAVSDAPGVLELYGASGPSASLISGWAGYSTRTHQTVTVTTLDALLGPGRPGERMLVKIDVEGAEYGVVRGAAATLRRTPGPLWLVEIFLNQFHPGGVNANYLATFELFWEAGYRAYTASDQPREVTRADVERAVASNWPVLDAYNFLFCPADAAPPTGSA